MSHRRVALHDRRHIRVRGVREAQPFTNLVMHTHQSHQQTRFEKAAYRGQPSSRRVDGFEWLHWGLQERGQYFGP